MSEVGVPEVLSVRPEFAAQLDALVVLLGAGLAEMDHERGCGCAEPDRFWAACVRRTMRAVRSETQPTDPMASGTRRG